MFNFQYEISVDEESGRPYINPIKETNNEMAYVEHKFMAFEIVRTMLIQYLQMMDRDPVKREALQDEYQRNVDTLRHIQKISDQYAQAIIDQKNLLGEFVNILNRFDIEVASIEERDQLNYNGIIYNDQIFVRKEGLRVKVDKDVYELKGGIDNIHWVLV